MAPGPLPLVLTEKIRNLQQAGEPEVARAQLSAWDTRELVDPVLHLELARLAEEVGDLSRAVLEYNLSLRDQPEQPELLRRLARLRSDQGDGPRALRAWQRLLELAPGDQEATLAVVGLLLDQGQREAARSLLQAQPARQSDPLLAQALARLRDELAGSETGVHLWPDRGASSRSGPSPAVGEAEEATPTGPTPEELQPRETDLVIFSSIFQGREGVHARQWAGAEGKSGYSPVREPFTPAVARHHLLGAYTVGIYPVRLDSTVLFLAFDLDLTRFALGQRGHARTRLLRLVHEYAARLAAAAEELELPVLVEDSGQKGRHVWLLFARPLPAAVARRLGDGILARTGPPPAEVTVELFPRQVKVAPGGLGNLIKLPLGIHRVTGRRCLLLGPDGSPWDDQLRVLRDAPRASRELVSAALSKLGTAAPVDQTSPATRWGMTSPDQAAPDLADEPPELSGQLLGPSADAGPGAAGPAAMVDQEPYALDQDVELLWLLDRCAVLAEVVRRAQQFHVLTEDERIVVTHTLGHLEHGPEAVNSILCQTLAVDPVLLLKSRLRGHPMSCPKLRSRLPGLAATVGCDCRFAPGAGLYPTPLLHLGELRAQGALPADPARLSALQVERLVTDLLRARAVLERTERTARELEARLLAVMEEQGLEQVTTAAGRLVRAGRQLQLSLGRPEP